jgi:oligopeptidase B
MTRAVPFLSLLVLTMSCTTSRHSGPGAAAVAEIVPHELTAHGDTRIDNYFWLKNRDDPAVMAYLKAENDYYDSVMGPLAPFEDELYQEIVARIKKNDDTVPYRYRDYYYYARFQEGNEYPIFCRKEGSLEAPEEIILDANDLAKGHEFFSIHGVRISSGQDILSFATDTVGRRFYDVRFKNLTTGELLEDTIPKVTGNVAWAEDGTTLFYSKQHPETLRSYRIFRHELGTDPAKDTQVYEEKDDTFSVSVWKTTSRSYVVITSEQTLSNEERYLPAAEPTATPTVFLPRERGHEYSIDHLGGAFWVRTNWQAKNFRLMKTTAPGKGKDAWQEVIGNRDDVFLESFELFNHHLVVSERKRGLLQLRVRSLADGEEHYLDFGEPAYIAWPTDNLEPSSTTLRYWYSSLTTPGSVYDYDMVLREKVLLKRDEVVGDFDPGNYVTERLEAPARDGRPVPISLVYRKGFERNGKSPLLLYGYGSYGASIDVYFDSARQSLLDRGFVLAIAHIRGGEELGRWWYEEGKLLNKKNTFTDFIDCAEYLIAQKYADPRRVFANGASAGGLLMGAVVNMRPELFNGVVADVPWVDVVTSMLDDSIPLTTSEYDEWGNPNEKAYYDYMLSYSPYDNVAARPYPNMLVTTSLHDSQVQYWEPAKWVAKLRANSTSDNLLLLKSDMAAGHGGKSGRMKSHRDTAMRYVFFLHLAGLADAK